MEPIVLVVRGRLAMGDTARLCDELTVQITSMGAADGADATGEAICDVGGLIRPDLIAVNTLARLHLTARRHGFRLRLRGAAPELHLLLGLVGLSVLAEEARP